MSSKVTHVGYDIRVSADSMDADQFGSAEPVDFPPLPGDPGSEQSFFVSGLDPDRTYFFAVASVDDQGRLSRFSNVATGTTAAGVDTIPPATITDLQAVDSTATSISFRWGASGDDGRMGIVENYELYVFKAAPLARGDDPDSVIEIRPTRTRPGNEVEVTIDALPRRSIWDFTIRAVDESHNRSRPSAPLRAGTAIVPMSFRVNVDGSGEFSTIQAAVDASLPGDTVLIGPGTYRQQIRVFSKPVVIRSVQGPELTRLDGRTLAGSVIRIEDVPPPGVEVNGLGITGGSGEEVFPANWRGGGILARNSSVTLRNNHIFENLPVSVGGAAYIGSSRNTPPDEILIEGNRFFDNDGSRSGAGLVVAGGTARIVNNWFENNSAVLDGGGLMTLTQFNDIVVEHNTFVGNYAGDHGAGAYIGDGAGDGRIRFRFNLLLDNRADGIEFTDSGAGGGVYLTGPGGEVINNTFVENLGTGESSCSGSGIGLHSTLGDLLIRANILVAHHGCAIGCRGPARGVLGQNLFWMNDLTVGGVDPTSCEFAWNDSVLIGNPDFCDPEGGNFRLRPTSAAITANGVMGAFTAVGCLTN